MSYKDKPQLRLYKFIDSAFVLQAIIDDFQEISFERNLYQAGTFTISINYNIPNALLFERGMFVQFGNDSYDFGEIITITDTIGADGKGSQIRTITGYDSRYILKRRVIKNMNSNGLWVMTAKGELCLRNLIKDQCGSGAEAKRQLPIINTIPASADAIGKEYSVSEQFTNLYEVCKTIATQSEIGWRLAFDGTSLTLECYQGTDRSQTVQFSTSFDSLADGQFTDSSESFSNAIYVGGKGQNDDRDIYEGENGTPSGLDRFESWDNQSSMTTESEYEAEALSMLTQYGQTIQMSGNGLAKCPYIYKEQYDVGDLITVAFSGKSAVVQILSVTEHWAWGSYDIQFSFGKPQNNLSEQLQLMLRKIQSASEKSQATDSVRWYTLPTDSSMPKADVTYNTIGFTGTLIANKTFTFYLDDEKTGAKSYNIYVKNLSGNFNLTLTTGRAGKTNYVLKGGVNLTGRILVDDEGNITSQSVTATSVIESGNNQPATSDAVASAIQGVTSLPTDAVLHYSFDEVPDYPDGTAIYFKNNNFTVTSDFNYRQCTGSIIDSKLNLKSNGNESYFQITGSSLSISNIAGKIVIVKFKVTGTLQRISLQNDGGSYSYQTFSLIKEISQNEYIAVTVAPASPKYNQLLAFKFKNASADNVALIEAIYIGNGSYSTPIIDNANGQNNATNNGGIAVEGVCGKSVSLLGSSYINGNLPWNPFDKKVYTISCWVKNWTKTAPLYLINNWITYAISTIYAVINATLSKHIVFDVPSGENMLRFVNTNFDFSQYDIMCITIVFNGTQSKFYINGQEITMTYSTISSWATTTKDRTNFQIGRCSVSEGFDYSKADIDDFLIFNRALSENEVMALYLNKANTPKYYSWADWKLNQMENANRSIVAETRNIEEPPIEESGEEER